MHHARIGRRCSAIDSGVRRKRNVLRCGIAVGSGTAIIAPFKRLGWAAGEKRESNDDK